MAATWRPSTARLLGLLVGIVAAVLLWWTQGDAGSDPDGPTGSPSSDTPSVQSSAPDDTGAATGEAGTDPSTDLSTDPSADPTDEPSFDLESGLPVISRADLPAGARDVLEQIDAGGPFDFPEHDGGVFENREELLPDQPLGYYREYTVDGRPGDRGPLRIVAGRGGERYWTEDHYRSFSRIAVEP